MACLAGDVFNDTPTITGAVKLGDGGRGNGEKSGCGDGVAVMMRIPSREEDERRGITRRVGEASPTLAVARAVRLAASTFLEEEEEEGVNVWVV